MLIMLLLIACSGDSDSSDTKQSAVINVYVYAPEKPMITRGDIGEVKPIDNTINESLITQLQIWVFNHDSEDHELIAYYSTESVTNLNNGIGETYQLSASDAFTQAENKPHVDVYVVANITAANSGMTLGESTTRAALEGALIQGSYFGLTTLQDKVPAKGLPMSGVLRGAPVSGSAPVYKISTVNLTRAVSKIRFIFCREKPADVQGDIPVKIKSVKLNKGMIPKEEYLFLGTSEMTPPYPNYHVGSYENDNVDDSKEFLPVNSDNVVQILTDIPKNDDPLLYVYQAQDAQVYEDLIAEALDNKDEDGVTPKPLLAQVGPFYLRESGKLLTGVITYQKGEEAERTAPFLMKTAGDFSRNHTWTVYAYYSKSGLVAVTVVVENWDNTDRSHEINNW